MQLTERQKNIINPYAQSLDSESRRGVGYQYDLEDNKYILDAIHEQYLYFYSFPLVGTRLIDSELTISERDYLAYFALYPQNGNYKNKDTAHG